MDLRASVRIGATAVLAGLLSMAAPLGHAEDAVLRVCADPNALPMSNHDRQGFDNEIAGLLARDMGVRLEHHWWAQRRGFIRNTLNAGACDVLFGVPAGFDRLLTTRPYYRSSYVFVWRRDRPLDVRSLDDPRLRRLIVGVQLVGDDGVNTPPAHALARRGIVDNVRGFSVFGDYAQPTPQAAILKAVADDQIDVAIVWGPLAGYFANRLATPLAFAPLAPVEDAPGLPFSFAMAIGVRKDDVSLRDRLQAALDRRASEVDAILDAYGIPRLDAPRP